jgi:SAM-dependent methyltransferase
VHKFLEKGASEKVDSRKFNLKMSESYHSFLSYNSQHSEDARIIYEYLHNSGFKIFFDKESIKPGESFQKALEKGIVASDSIIVLIGQDGLGPWQEEESYAWQMLSVSPGSKKRYIPVFLPGSSHEADQDKLPLFLRQYNHIQFRDVIDDEKILFQLVEAVPKSYSRGESFERPLLRAEQNSLLQQTVEFYTKNSEHFYERWRDALPLPALYAFIQTCREYKKNPSILDVGCGPGHHSAFLTSEGGVVTGIDMSSKMLEIAKKTNNKSSRFVLGDMRDLQVIFKARNLYDAIWACGSCFHISRESIEGQLYEFIAILKPKGVLGISLQSDAPSVIQADGRFFERYAEHEIIGFLERLGFEIINVNISVSRRSLDDKRKVKKWVNIVALAPSEKQVIAPYRH